MRAISSQIESDVYLDLKHRSTCRSSAPSSKSGQEIFHRHPLFPDDAGRPPRQRKDGRGEELTGPLGPGWDFGFRMRLREVPNGDIELYDGRLRRELFEKNGDASYQSPSGLFAVLTKSSSGFLLIESDHSFVRFDLWGRLISIADGLN